MPGDGQALSFPGLGPRMAAVCSTQELPRHASECGELRTPQGQPLSVQALWIGCKQDFFRVQSLRGSEACLFHRGEQLMRS